MNRNIFKRACACFLAVLMITGTTMTAFAAENEQIVEPKQQQQ